MTGSSRAEWGEYYERFLDLLLEFDEDALGAKKGPEMMAQYLADIAYSLSMRDRSGG